MGRNDFFWVVIRACCWGIMIPQRFFVGAGDRHPATRPQHVSGPPRQQGCMLAGVLLMFRVAAAFCALDTGVVSLLIAGFASVDTRFF
jgi:hypothetical protein